MDKIDHNLKEIVLYKIQCCDDNNQTLIGNLVLDKKSLFREVWRETKVGKIIISSWHNYTRDLINGKIIKLIKKEI
ncbi:MAG: hypothetical protein WDA13_00130 [Candidatus Shapirobacteria bacterium]